MYGVTAHLSRTGRFNVSRLFQHLLSLNGPNKLHSRCFTTQEEVENYYVLKDIRDSTKCRGFDENDPRSKFTGRDDSTEDYMDEIEQENEVELESGKLPERVDGSVPLYKKCKLTKTLIKVELPIKKLDSEEIISSILFLFPNLPFDVDVKDLFSYLRGGIVPSDDQIRRIKMLEPRISDLLTYNHFNLKQSLVVALVFDHFGILTHELRNKLLLAMQLNIYAFRPYDIAVAVHIYGKVKGRYEPFINTLGLVFYDLMIGGKTSLCPNGPSLNETLAVLSSFTSVGFSTSKLTDPIFGYLYDQLNNMSETQMIFALKSFFTISGDSKFVEFYSRILSILFNKPLLFVENFQDHVQKTLSSDFGIQPVSVEAYSKNVDFSSDISSLLLLFDALSNCKSEFLISSIHNRIEFKRLWSHNIKTGNMPWKIPGVDKVEEMDGIEYKDTPKLSVTYKDQLPDLYMRVSKMIKDTFGPILSCTGIIKYIFEHNKGVTSSIKVMDDPKVAIPYHVYFPYTSSIQAASTLGAPEDDSDSLVFPIFKMKMDALLEYKDVLTANKDAKMFHVHNLAKFCNNMGIRTETLKFVQKGMDIDEWINEVIHGLTLGNVSLLEGRRDDIEFLNVKAMDLANCIAFINDYSRYTDVLPVDILGTLYYRLLYTKQTRSASLVDNIIALLEKICPKSLVFDNPHSTYTEDSEFYKTKHGTEYYLPPPSTASLFKGDKGLCSILFYTFSHYFHYYITPSVSSMTESQINKINAVLQHLMYPLYVCSRIGSRPTLVWDMAYFLGMLNKKDILYSDLKTLSTLESTNVMDVVTTSEECLHIYKAFVNVASLYFKGLVTRLDGDDKLSLRSQVKVLKSVLMLESLNKLFQEPHTTSNTLVNISFNNILSYFADPKKEELDNRLTVEDDVICMQVLSDALDLGNFDNTYNVLNHVTLSIFKRIKYYSPEEVIPLLSSLSSIINHFRRINVENDEFLEQVSQSVEIVRGQLLDTVTLEHLSCGVVNKEKDAFCS